MSQSINCETSDQEIKELTSGGSTSQRDKIGFNDNSEARGHEIRKRSPVPPLFPLMWKSCAFGAKIGVGISKKLYGPIGLIAGPVAGKIVKTKLCPLLALAG